MLDSQTQSRQFNISNLGPQQSSMYFKGMSSQIMNIQQQLMKPSAIKKFTKKYDFQTRMCTKRLHLDTIGKLSHIQQIYLKNDFSTIESYLPNILESTITSEEYQFIEQGAKLNLLKYLQFVIQYFQYTHTQLDSVIEGTENEIELFEYNSTIAERETIQLNKEIKDLRNEKHELEKQLFKYKKFLERKPTFKCQYCTNKYFRNKEYLVAHFHKRHAMLINPVSNKKVLDSFMILPSHLALMRQKKLHYQQFSNDYQSQRKDFDSQSQQQMQQIQFSNQQLAIPDGQIGESSIMHQKKVSKYEVMQMQREADQEKLLKNIEALMQQTKAEIMLLQRDLEDKVEKMEHQNKEQAKKKIQTDASFKTELGQLRGQIATVISKLDKIGRGQFKKRKKGDDDDDDDEDDEDEDEEYEKDKDDQGHGEDQNSEAEIFKEDEDENNNENGQANQKNQQDNLVDLKLHLNKQQKKLASTQVIAQANVKYNAGELESDEGDSQQKSKSGSDSGDSQKKGSKSGDDEEEDDDDSSNENVQKKKQEQRKMDQEQQEKMEKYRKEESNFLKVKEERDHINQEDNKLDIQRIKNQVFSYLTKELEKNNIKKSVYDLDNLPLQEIQEYHETIVVNANNFSQSSSSSKKDKDSQDNDESKNSSDAEGSQKGGALAKNNKDNIFLQNQADKRRKSKESEDEEENKDQVGHVQRQSYNQPKGRKSSTLNFSEAMTQQQHPKNASLPTGEMNPMKQREQNFNQPIFNPYTKQEIQGQLLKFKYESLDLTSNDPSSKKISLIEQDFDKISDAPFGKRIAGYNPNSFPKNF